MKLLIAFFAALLAINLQARAEVQIESACYFYQSTTKPYQRSQFVLQSYYDTGLQKMVGGFVRYSKGQNAIPLVFQKRVETDTEDPALGNFEIHWLEVVGNQITGTYMLAQTGAGIRQGRYVNYTNSKTKRTLIFQKSGAASECEE